MIPAILKHVQSLGYRIFDGGHAYNLNIIGIRAHQNGNSFNDFLCCAYREREDGPWTVKYWAATTDPGEFCLENPEVYGTEAGTAIVVPGQYQGVYKLDLHRGKYEALCQRNGKIKVYRDGNKDDVLDMDPDTIQEGYFGCNIHKAGANSTQVDKWSAGCQVFSRNADFEELISLCHKQIETHPTWAPAFTYTLITEW